MANTVRLEESFTDITGKDLANTSQLKLFNILEDEDGVKLQNVWRSYSLNPDVAEETYFFTGYNMNDDDWWDNISFSAYDTPLLWWILCVVNNIQNPFEEVNPGQETNILRDNYIYQVIKEIEIISELGRAD
jgi:hypothetical protein